MLESVSEPPKDGLRDTSATGDSGQVAEEIAASRISAYAYGNILMLAALIPITHNESWTRPIAILVGTAASTFAAHAFTDGVARAAQSGTPLTRQQRWRELRNSLPILSSAAVPILLMLTVPLGWFKPSSALLVAEIAILLRISSMAFVIGRLRAQRPSGSTLVAAVPIAVIAATIVIFKVVATQH